MNVGDKIEFDAGDSPITIPQGDYVGEIVDTDFALGSNSMNRTWCTVLVNDGSVLDGQQLTIYKQQSVAQH